MLPLFCFMFGTNDVCCRTRSPAIIRRLFELLVEQILSIVPNARILISSILPRLRDFEETNDKIRSMNNDLEHNSIRHTFFIRTCGPFLRGGIPRDEMYRDEETCSLGRCGSLSTGRCKCDIYKLGN